MPDHHEKYCPRCHELFTCNSGDIERCQCRSVQLSLQTRQVLQETASGCLCRKCLEEMEAEVKAAGTDAIELGPLYFRERPPQ